MKRNYPVVALVFLIFFVISLLTNILGSVIDNFERDFHLSHALAAALPFFFFVAYVVSIPAGMIIERYHEKPVLVVSFGLALVGSCLFSVLPYFSIALVSVFLIGVGMAMLQVAINPLLRVSGGEEHFAFLSVLAQLVFGAASFLSPQIYSYLEQNVRIVQSGGIGAPAPNWLIGALATVVPDGLPWTSVYWVFLFVTLLMTVILAAVRLPRVELTDEEKPGALETHWRLLSNRVVILYFVGIFAYVGTEQGIADWIKTFLKSTHGFDPATQGANALSGFWGLMTVGCLLGLGLLKLFDSRRILIAFALAAIVTLSFALFGPPMVSLWAFPLLGFCASVMWSIIFSLGLNSVAKYHGSFSGILCTGIIGGAVVPLVIGWLGDHFGLRQGMFFLYLTLGYILSIGFWARPLISNATVTPKQMMAALTQAIRRREGAEASR